MRALTTAWPALLLCALVSGCGDVNADEDGGPKGADVDDDEGPPQEPSEPDAGPATPDPGPNPGPGPTPNPNPNPTPSSDAGPDDEPPALPVITSFLVDGGSSVVLSAAADVTLSWAVSDADSCSINQGVGSVDASAGSRTVSVDGPKNFTLSCTSAAGTASSSVSVAFELPAEILFFTVDGNDAAEVLAGSDVTLSWDTSNALTCAIDNGVGAVDTVGTREVAVTSDVTFTLTCEGPLGEVSSSVAVTVYFPPSIDSFTSDVAQMRAFVDEATLSWAVSHADSCSISPDLGTVSATGGTALVSSDEVNVTLGYTLSCTGRGGTDTASVSIDVPEVVHSGNFVLTASNGSQLVGVNRVTGSVAVQSLFLSSMPYFDTLLAIEGELYVKANPGVTSLSIPRLEAVGSHLTVIDNDALATLSLPALVDVGGYVTIDDLQALSTLTMSSLAHVGGNFYVSHAPQLPAGVAQAIANGADVDGDVLVYGNVLTTILSDIQQAFLCEVPSHWPSSNWKYQFQVHTGGNAYMFTPNASTGAFSTYESGTWTRVGDALRLNFPSKGNLPTSGLYTEFDAIVSFTMNTKPCGTLSLGPGTGITPAPTYQCDNTNYEPGVYLDSDSFELFTDSSVRWVRQTDLLGSYSDTWWTTRIGSYFQLGNRIYFAFPSLGEDPWLTATKTLNGLVFDDLGTNNNGCTKQ